MKKRMLVIGDIAVDQHIKLVKKRLMDFETPEEQQRKSIDIYTEQETTSKIIAVSGRTCRLLNKYHVDVSFASTIGQDINSKKIIEIFKNELIKTDLLILDEKIKIYSYKMYTKENTSFIIDNNHNHNTQPEIEKLTQKILPELKRFDAVLIALTLQKPSSVGYLNLVKQVIQNHHCVFIEPCKTFGEHLIKYRASELKSYQHAFSIKANRKETEQLLNLNMSVRGNITEALSYLKHQCKIQHPIITLDTDGLFFLDKHNEMQHIKPKNSSIPKNLWGNGEVAYASIIAMYLNGFGMGTNNFNKTMKNLEYFTNQSPEKTLSWEEMIKQ